MKKQEKTHNGCRGIVNAGAHDSFEHSKKITKSRLLRKQEKTHNGCRSSRNTGDDDPLVCKRKTANSRLTGKQKNTHRAQASVEFLMVLSVSLLVLLVFIGLSQSESVGVDLTKTRTQASNAVKDISAAAQDVYAQGEGAKKKILIKIPFGYEPLKSGVWGRSVKIRAGENDYVETVDFDLTGSLPSTPGLHEIWIVSEGSSVQIGNAMISLGRQSINTVMNANATKVESFFVKNEWDSAITVMIVQEWSHGDVSMALSTNSFVLAQGESRVVDVTFTSAGDALGFYSGSLKISGSDGAVNETIILPVTVEVSTMGTGDGPPLTVVPSTWRIAQSRNSNATKSFQVCTNSETSLAYVDFSPSTGVPGDWVGLSSPLGTIEPATCVAKTLSIGIPSDAELKNHSGYIYLSGDQGEDSIALSVFVGGMVDDTFAPNLTDVRVFPSGRQRFENTPVAIRVTADDNGRGDNTIESCRVRVDGGSWYQMISKDGSFDEIAETAGYTFYSGFSMGLHNATVECSDIRNNTAQGNESFSIMKEFLFITQDTVPKATEHAWMDWIGLGLSNEGYAWNLDSVDSATFMAGSPNTTFYSVLVAERFVPGMEIMLNTHTNAGGSIVMLGHALAESPAALGVSVQSSNIPANETATNIVNGNHYITSGYSGNTTVVNQTIEFQRFWKDLSGILLGKSTVGAPPQYHTLGVAGKRYFWGLPRPDYLNPTGINITTRTLDHAVNASTRGIE